MRQIRTSCPRPLAHETLAHRDKIPRFTVAVDDNNAYVTYHTLTLSHSHARMGILRHEERPMKRTVALGILLLATLLVLGGCNTVRGMGQDIEQGGEAIQRSAD